MATVTAPAGPQVMTGSRRPLKPAAWYVGRIVRYGMVILVGMVLLSPFILAFLGSFKTDREILSYPPTFLPTEWHPENWARVWAASAGPGATFPRWMFNSAFLAVVHAITNVFFCSLAAFAFARLRFPGKNLIFSLMLVTMMIPSAVFLVPGYILITQLGWINQYQSLIVPNIVSAFGIFLLTQFFKSIPRELEEAAIVDGANLWQIYWHLILPLSRPALLTLTIIAFQSMFNAYLGPLLYMQDPSMYTMTVGLKLLQGQYYAAWNLILAGSMFSAIPILIIFFIFNKYFIEGIAYTGLKG